MEDLERLERIKAVKRMIDRIDDELDFIDAVGYSVKECQKTVHSMLKWLQDAWRDAEFTDSMHCAVSLCLCLLTLQRVYGVRTPDPETAFDKLEAQREGLSKRLDELEDGLEGGEKTDE